MQTLSLCILGSTGSIGKQALDVLRTHNLRPVALAARKNATLLETQAREFLPERIAIADESVGKLLKIRLADSPIRVTYGKAAVEALTADPEINTVLNAFGGAAGLPLTISALEAGKRLLLANKESLVCGGERVTALAREKNLPIIPIDSEHSAIFQCLVGAEPHAMPTMPPPDLRRIILTASGGPFRGYTRTQLADVTAEQSLRHPIWTMGRKVTIDSATLLNKGLEVIEAVHLFGVSPDKIDVLVHPQSIIHSLVEYTDGAQIAQLGCPDMRLPIQYALFFPASSFAHRAFLRGDYGGDRLDLTAKPLTFEPPDLEAFPCLALAFQAVRKGGNAGAVLAGAGEGAVDAFLSGKCGFLDIPARIERALETVPHIADPSLDDLLRSIDEGVCVGRD